MNLQDRAMTYKIKRSSAAWSFKDNEVGVIICDGAAIVTLLTIFEIAGGRLGELGSVAVVVGFRDAWPPHGFGRNIPHQESTDPGNSVIFPIVLWELPGGALLLRRGIFLTESGRRERRRRGGR